MSNLKALLVLLVGLLFTGEVPNKAFSMEDNNQSAQWDDLPKELQAKILGEHMGVKDNANAGLVNKDWQQSANDDIEWQKRYEKDFPESKKELKEGETWKDAYFQNSFWSIKPYYSLSSSLGCNYQEDKNLPWCKFASRLDSFYGGVAFIKQNENNRRQIRMLTSALENVMNPQHVTQDDDLIRFDNEYPKIQILHSTTVNLSYKDIREMCTNSSLGENATPIIYTQQKGAKIMEGAYPLLCKKIDNEMKQGKDGMIPAYKFKMMMPPVDTATHEAEVEFYLFKGN